MWCAAALGLASLVVCAFLPRAWLALDAELHDRVAVIEAWRSGSRVDPWGRDWVAVEARFSTQALWSAGPNGQFDNGQRDDHYVGAARASDLLDRAALAAVLERGLPLPYRRPLLVCAGAWLLACALLVCDRLGRRARRPIVRRWLAVAGGGCAGVAAWLLARGVLTGPLRWQPWDVSGQLRPRLQLDLPPLLQPAILPAAVAIGVGVAIVLGLRGRRSEGASPADDQGDRLRMGIW